MKDVWHNDTHTAKVPDTFPWPPPEGGGTIAAITDTWRSATFDPGTFFRLIPREGGTGAALLYYLVIGVLVAGASLFWDTVTGQAGMAQEQIAGEGGVGQPIVMFLLSPLILIIAVGLAAAVTHLLLLLFRGASHRIDTTIRVFCYAYSPMIFGVVPVVGTVVGTVWMVGLAIIGLREAHETTTWKAGMAVMLPFLLLVGTVALALMALMAAGATILG